MQIRYKLKKLMKQKIVILIVAFLISWILRILYSSLSCRIVGKDAFDNISGAAIVCFWHGRMVMMPFLVDKKHKINLLSSSHSDGQFVAQIQKHFGTNIIFGSSSNGGFSAMREFFRVKQRGEIIVMTPDGPRGPARKVGGAIVKIAKKLDIPIIPVTFSCNKYKTVQSWDSLMLTKPFSRGIFIIGEAKRYESEAELEAALNKITDEADSAFKTL
jgi:lysophospholipid acyltransferase (LPLAT)-like uncharacterized protein